MVIVVLACCFVLPNYRTDTRLDIACRKGRERSGRGRGRGRGRTPDMTIKALIVMVALLQNSFAFVHKSVSMFGKVLKLSVAWNDQLPESLEISVKDADVICYKDRNEEYLQLGLVTDCSSRKEVLCVPLSVVENDFKTIRSKTSDLSEDVVSYDHIVSTVATTAAKQKKCGKGVDGYQYELLDTTWTAIEARMSMPFKTEEEEENVFEDRIHQEWRLKDDRLLYSLYKNDASLDYLMTRLERGKQGILRRIQHIEDSSHNAHKRFFGVPLDDEKINMDGVGSVKMEPLKPIKEVKIRLIYGIGLLLSDFSFGYMDRFDGIKESQANSSNVNIKGKERLLLKAIPDHRIEYVKYKERVIWDKKERIDLVFGSGPNESSKNYKLERIIEEYDGWWEEEQRRRKLLEEELQLLAQVEITDKRERGNGDVSNGDESKGKTGNGLNSSVVAETDEENVYDDSLLIDEDEFLRGI